MSLAPAITPVGVMTGSIQPSLQQRDRMLQVTRDDLTAALRAAGPTNGLLSILTHHALTAWRLSIAGVHYLATGDAVADTYRRMTSAEFIHLNARQAWANWRTISRNLHGNLPTDRPLTVLDLCCGMGESTAVLAWWLPTGSRIVGIELDHRFAAAAAKRRYHNRTGAPIDVGVHHGSILDGFQDHQGRRMGDHSVDVVHAIGAIGCHFTDQQTRAVVRECARVLRPDGVAFLDAGPSGTTTDQMIALAHESGLRCCGWQRSWWFDRYRQVVLRAA